MTRVALTKHDYRCMCPKCRRCMCLQDGMCYAQVLLLPLGNKCMHFTNSICLHNVGFKLLIYKASKTCSTASVRALQTTLNIVLSNLFKQSMFWVRWSAIDEELELFVVCLDASDFAVGWCCLIRISRRCVVLPTYWLPHQHLNK